MQLREEPLEYKIASGSGMYSDDAVRDLEKYVNLFCERDGYRPQGGICVIRESEYVWDAYQALVKE